MGGRKREEAVLDEEEEEGGGGALGEEKVDELAESAVERLASNEMCVSGREEEVEVTEGTEEMEGFAIDGEGRAKRS
jgi:hypothetical protein